MPRSYTVTWEIDIEAGTPAEAARIAKQVQADPGSSANVFDVRLLGTDESEMIDLDDPNLNPDSPTEI